MKHNLEFYIDGAWVKPDSTATVAVINPATEQEIAPVAMANDTVYGLTNYVQTQDEGKARRVHVR